MIEISSLDPTKTHMIRITILFEDQRYQECACGLTVDGETLVADPSWLLPPQNRIPMDKILLDPRSVDERGWPVALFYALEVPVHSIPGSSTQALADLLDQLSKK